MTYRRQLLVVPLHRLVDRLRLAAIDQQGVRGVLLLEVDDDGASLDGLVKREARHVVRADDDDGLICSLVEHSQPIIDRHIHMLILSCVRGTCRVLPDHEVLEEQAPRKRLAVSQVLPQRHVDDGSLRQL